MTATEKEALGLALCLVVGRIRPEHVNEGGAKLLGCVTPDPGPPEIMGAARAYVDYAIDVLLRTNRGISQ